MWSPFRFPFRWRYRGDDAGPPPVEPEGRAAHPSGTAASRAAELGDEVEALLAGRLVEYLVGSRRPVAAWAALNRVAHGDHGALVRLLASDGVVELDEKGREWERPWAESERRLASRLLASGSDPDGLHSIQQSVLVPLEMVLVEQQKAGPVTGHDVIERASEALDQHLTDR